MPPKKLDRSSKKPQGKSPRSRAKKDAPVLKTPTLLKLKIPKQFFQKPATETSNIDNVVKKPNEDACQQESPIEPKVNENIPVLEIGKEKKTATKTKQVIKRKRVLKRKVPEGTTVSSDIVQSVKKRRTKVTKPDVDNGIGKEGSIEENQDLYNAPELNKNYTKIVLANEEEIQHTEILQGKKVTARKKQTVNRKQKHKNNVENGGTALTAGEPTKRKIVPRINHRKCTNAMNKDEVKPIRTIKKQSKGNVNINSESTFQPARRNQRLYLNRNISKAGPVLQNNNNNIVKETISITCLNNDTPQSNLTVDTTEAIIGNCQIDENRSVACSDNSWAKDVSSSSATSLVTVVQDDFMLINNKFPILQLTHIDREVMKNKKEIGIINNYHEEIKPQNNVGNCVTFKANNVIETDLPNTSLDDTEIKADEELGSSNIISKGHIVEHTNNYDVYKTHIPCTSLDLNISTSSNSTPSSSSNTGSSTTNLSQTTTIDSSATSRNNIWQKTDKYAPKKDSDKANTGVPGPAIALISTSTANLGKNETSDLSNHINNVNTNLQKLALNMKKLRLDKIQSQIANKHLNNNSVVDSRIKRLQDKIITEEILRYEKKLIHLGLGFIKFAANDIKESETADIDDTCNYSNCQESSYHSSSNYIQTFNDSENISMNDERKINESLKQNDDLQEELQNPRENLVSICTTGDKFNKDNVSSNKMNHTFVDHDDDDALSLFAESITAIESCRKSSINNSGLEIPEREEYNPRCKNIITPINYRPTKMTNENIVDRNRIETKMSEEDNVTSTLVFDESRNKNPESNLFYEDRVGNYLQNSAKLSNTINTNQMSTTPRLLASIYRPMQGKSYVFSGSCYFNLKSTCKNPNCKYPHVNNSVNDVQNKLLQLSEESFIQEYMRMRSWPKLRRLYGLCFVKECIRRNLTRILVEMAIDFLKNNNNSIEDNTKKCEIIDSILMYLNGAELSTCDDLLRYNIQPADTVLLCDTFISIIAKSQNFSRFKPIFIKLSQFMHGIGRRFNVEIVESILERICILPYEEMLARSLLLITRNTDITIFCNKHIGNLERQLQMFNNQLYQELKSLKAQALLCLPILANCYVQSPRLQNEHNKLDINSLEDNYKTHSPDLPDMTRALSPRVRHVHVGENDKNKTNFEITFSRNVDIENFKRKITNEITTTISKDNNSVRNNFENWKHRSIFDRVQDQNRIPSQPNLRMPFKRPCTDQSFEASPAKFQRHSGPSNY